MQNPKIALLIDEDRNARLLLSIRLEDMGFKVLQAHNAHQAQNYLRQEKVDVVIADWSLPGLDNGQLLEMVEPEARPVYLFTDHAPETATAFIDQSRVKAVVSKKKRHELLALMTEELGLSSSGPGQPAGHPRAHSKPVSADPNPSLHEDKPGSKRILVVEDSWSIRHFVKRVLQDQWAGSVILEAKNGVEALEQMGATRVDVVVTDLEMPEMGGRELVARMREMPHWKEKPVVVLSVYSPEEVQNKFGSDPYVRFLVKPAAAEQIVEALKPFMGETKRVLSSEF